MMRTRCIISSLVRRNGRYNALASSQHRLAPSMTMSTLASFPYSPDAPDPDYVVPLAKNGFDPDLNWSLGDDGFTLGGDAFRNARELALLQYSEGSLTKQKAVIKSPEEPKRVPMFATDEFEGFQVMDVDEAEYLREQVSEDMYHRKRLFVEDAAFGSNRLCEIKVRTVSDTAETNLFFRNMLHRIPLDIPDCFPRHILVVTNDHWDKSDPRIICDIDTEANSATKAVVVAAGKVPLAQVAESVAFCATHLATKGGYRDEFGGGMRARIAKENGRLELFYTDRYWKADKNAPHPDLVLLNGHAVTNNETGDVTLVLNASEKLASDIMSSNHKASSKLSLYAAHNVFLDENGLSRAWNGRYGDTSAFGGNASLPRGSLVEGKRAFSAFEAPLSTFKHPNNVIIVGGGSKTAKKEDGIKLIGESQNLTEEQLGKLKNILGNKDISVKQVKDEKSVLKELYPK